MEYRHVRELAVDDSSCSTNHRSKNRSDSIGKATIQGMFPKQVTGDEPYVFWGSFGINHVAPSTASSVFIWGLGCKTSSMTTRM